MNPHFPVYIVSKNRADSRLTSRTLEAMKVPYYIVVEEEQYEMYRSVIDRQKVLVLDKQYQRDYDTCDDLGDTKSKGPGAARNFAWEHSIAAGFTWHWVMDDNIRNFYRLHQNTRYTVADGTCLRAMEDFALRYQNIGMAGPAYRFFIAARCKHPPFVANTRIYSCNLIRNDVPFRWRGRYNEDTDLSLRMLKAGWCTVQFKVFLQGKEATQTVRGGCNTDFYQKEGTLPKSQMLVKLHPDVAKLTYRFHRAHHFVDYRKFKTLKLIRRPDVSQAKQYSMQLVDRPPTIKRDTHA